MEELTANEDVELWLFRMPLDVSCPSFPPLPFDLLPLPQSKPTPLPHHHKFNAEKLAKIKLKIDEAAGRGGVLQVTDVQRARREANQDDQDEDGMPGGEASGDSYEVLLGDASEIGAYQVLVQASRDAAGVLRVAPSITRHLVVAQCPPNTPSAAARGESVDDEKQPAIMALARPSRMVVPYTHVPQIQGLEARFKMPGAGSAPPPPQWWKEGVEMEKEEKGDEEKEKEKKMKATEEKEEEGKKEKKKKKKHRASDGGPLKKGGEGGEEDMSSPEKKAKKDHKQKKSPRRQSV